MTPRHKRTRHPLLASAFAVLLCLSVVLPSIATCCPPQPGDGVAYLAAVHRCCTAAHSICKAAKNASAVQASLLPPGASLAFIAAVEPLSRAASHDGSAHFIQQIGAAPHTTPLRI